MVNALLLIDSRDPMPVQVDYQLRRNVAPKTLTSSSTPLASGKVWGDIQLPDTYEGLGFLPNQEATFELRDGTQYQIQLETPDGGTDCVGFSGRFRAQA